MKTFYRTIIALHISLVILFLTIGPAADDTSTSVANVVEVRGPVFNSNIDIIDTMSDPNVINEDQFAAFYDIDDDVKTTFPFKGNFFFF
jgi:hypothetical protein